MKSILLLILSCTPCLAQFGGVDLPFFAKPNTATFPSTGLYLRWVASDLAQNVNVSNWVDRIQSYHLIQTDLTKAPTNTAVGVQFTAQLYLNATNMDSAHVPAGHGAFYIIYKMDYEPSIIGVFADSTAADTDTWFNYSGGKNFWSIFPPGTASGPINTNVITDYFYGNLGGATTVYTNGVHDTGTSFGVNYNCTTIGPLGTPTSQQYEIIEFAWYTNTDATTALATSLTAYRRSVYGGE